MGGEESLISLGNANDKALEEALDRIPSSFDRLQEAHFWIHGLEQYYHFSSQFRWHLSAFLKAIKEIPNLLQMELQGEQEFKNIFRDKLSDLRNDPLINHMAKQRDEVVHQRMLLPESKCTVGVTELRGMKLGMGFPVDPRDDSDHAMHRYLYEVAENEDFLGILVPDEDSIPCVHREWRFTGFEEEIIDLTAKAWLRTGETVAEVVEWLGAEPPPLSLSCRHGEQKVKFKLFERAQLQQQLSELQ